MVTATTAPLVDPALAWGAIVGPFIVGILGAFVAWMKRNDPLTPPPPPTSIPPAALPPLTPTSPDPAMLALQEANAKLLSMTERHIAVAEERAAFLTVENGELRRENANLKDRNSELRQELSVSRLEVTNLTSKVEVLQMRLDERGRRG